MNGDLISKPRWSAEISLGNILSSLASIVAVSVVVLTFAWNTSARMTAIETRLDLEILAGTEARTAFIPKVLSQEVAAKIQEERISRISDAIRDLRASNTELIKTIADLRVAVAILNGQTSRSPEVNKGVTK